MGKGEAMDNRPGQRPGVQLALEGTPGLFGRRTVASLVLENPQRLKVLISRRVVRDFHIPWHGDFLDASPHV